MDESINLFVYQVVIGASCVPGTAAKLTLQNQWKTRPGSSQAAMLVAELTDSVSSCEKFPLHLPSLKSQCAGFLQAGG